MQNRLILVKVNSCCFFLILFLLVSTAGFSQKIDFKSDLMIADSIAKKQILLPSKRAYIFKNQKKTFRNSNPVSLIYGSSLYVYQNLFSQHLSASCLYSPSCSDFSKHAVKEFGLVKGALLSFDRLNRCNRIAATDLNPAEIDKHSHTFSDPIFKY